ncbi:SAV_2336 N-terminal domain-related protein [Streptomyces chartreusis]|uniref:SAV_2336 N-terminal domain-related protein n=1 Tax=Streptomyces chartreusis TaxID=1969 RepID=UPI0033B2F7DF
MAEHAAAAGLVTLGGPDPDVEELLDAVLLAAVWSRDGRFPDRRTAEAADDLAPPDPSESSDPASAPPAARTRDAAETTDVATAWLAQPAGTRLVRGERMSVGRAAALPDALSMGRALRPLRRPWRCGVHRVLDIDATVEHYTRTGMLVPRLAPAPEPWLEVIVVMDRGTSMTVWDEPVRALTRTLRALTAFRDVRLWHLDHPPGGVPVLRDHLNNSRPMDPDAARHTQPARRLLLVVSDCAAPAWRQDALWRTLHLWGRTAPVALLNPLPERLWQRSGLDLPRTTATATVPASPGRLLAYRRPRLLRKSPGAEPWQALPVLQFDPARVLAWARTLMRTDPSGCEAVLVPATGRPLRHRPSPSPPAPRVEASSVPGSTVRARAVAFTDDRQSPAVRLALAVAQFDSFTMPLLEVLRALLVPDAALADIAEFLTAGLLTATRHASCDTVYRLHPEASDHLEGLLTRDQLWDMRFAFNDYLAAHLQAPHGITVVLHSPDADEALRTGLRHIASASAAIARRLGVEPADSLPDGASLPPAPAQSPGTAQDDSEPAGLHDTPRSTSPAPLDASAATPTPPEAPPERTEAPPQSFAELWEQLDALEGVLVTADKDQALRLDQHADGYRWAGLAWDGLLALNDYARASREGVEETFERYCLSPPDGAITWPLRRLGKDEQDAITNAAARERLFPVPADVAPTRRAAMSTYLSLGPARGVSSRVYFLDDTRGTTGRIVVGYIGLHLTVVERPVRSSDVAHVLFNEYSLDLPRRMLIEFMDVTLSKAKGTEITPYEIWEAFQNEYLPAPGAPWTRLQLSFRSPTDENSSDNVTADITWDRVNTATLPVTLLTDSTDRQIPALLDALWPLGIDVRLVDYSEHHHPGPAGTTAAYAECELGGKVVWGAGIDSHPSLAALQAVASAVNRTLRRTPVTPHPPESPAHTLDMPVRKVEVALKWNAAPAGQPPMSLDLVAAVYLAADPYGPPAQLVHGDSPFPDGGIHLNRSSSDGKGFGWKEVMTLELDRLAAHYVRVVVGVAIGPSHLSRTFSDVDAPIFRIREGYTVLAEGPFGEVLEASAATIGAFTRDEEGTWRLHPGVHGFTGELHSFPAFMGQADGS